MLLGKEPPSEPKCEPTHHQVRRVIVTNEMLRELLHLPTGTAVVGYCESRSWNSFLPALELKVLHPDFSPVLPGTEIPVVTPLFRRVETPGQSVEFVSWEEPII